mmetsp:Transcript_13893/g.22947  ORF Transcript_13893/g.22947 Transcript_13893/m.22947 type:complete len:336 (+) Transcript_13893:2167-3174(+)
MFTGMSGGGGGLQANSAAQAQAQAHAAAAAAAAASMGVGKPSANAAAAAAAAAAVAASLQQNAATKATNNCRIYVGSVAWNISETDLRAVFSPFGPIKSCILMPNPETGKHKGYGFIEFEYDQSADDAISAMNGFELGQRQLRVGRATAHGVPIFPDMPTTMPTQTPMFFSSTSNNTPSTSAATLSLHQQKFMQLQSDLQQQQASLSQEENVTIRSSQRLMVMQKLARGGGSTDKQPSRCVVLRNMVTPKDVDEDLELEVTEECGKFGVVEQVVINQERQSDRHDDVLVKIFVFFKTYEASSAAVSSLNNRFFGGRVVRAERYDEARFMSKDYSG